MSEARLRAFGVADAEPIVLCEPHFPRRAAFFASIGLPADAPVEEYDEDRIAPENRVCFECLAETIS